MKDNKFTQFINNNDIKGSNQAYVITKILCHKKGDNGKNQDYLWFKLLQIKEYEKEGSIVRQIFILDYFTYNIDTYKDISVGALVSYRTSDYIGKKCSIVEIKEI